MSKKVKYPPDFLDAVCYCEVVDILDAKKDIPADHEIFKKNPKKNIMGLRHENHFGIVSIEENRIVWCFQGTKTLADLADDVDALVKVKGAARGFWEAAELFKKDLIDICSSCGDDRSIIFYGHSLGGSIAINCAKMVSEIFGFKCKARTFGAPLNGDAEFRDAFRLLPIDSMRIQIHKDFVCGVPPEGLGYETESFVFTLNDKPWYRLPIPKVLIPAYIAWKTKVHLDYYNNVRKWS